MHFLLWEWVVSDSLVAFAITVAGASQPFSRTAALCWCVWLQSSFTTTTTSTTTTDHVQHSRRSHRCCIQHRHDFSFLLDPFKLCDVHSWWVRFFCCLSKEHLKMSMQSMEVHIVIITTQNWSWRFSTVELILRRVPFHFSISRWHVIPSKLTLTHTVDY